MIKNLKTLRLNSGLSQKQLGDLVGVSQQSINKYENHDVEPDISTLILLADCFKTSVDYLIGNTEVNHIIEEVKSYELNDDESALIEGYRKLTSDEKESIRLVIKNYNAKILPDYDFRKNVGFCIFFHL